MEITPEEAKYWADKRILESSGHQLADRSIESKATAIAIGISPENYDAIIGEPQIEKDIQDLAKSYEQIIEVLDYYMDIPDNHKKLISMWILGTYIHKTFPTYPFLFINAMRGSGKTRLLKILSHLADNANGMVSTQPSDSVMFRTPKHHTLIFDEFENIGGKDKANFRLYLNASYKSGGVVQRSRKVKKQDGETFEIETFEPYKPIAMANIWGMEEVVQDRCLTLILQKSNNPAKTKKIEDFERNVTISSIKRTLKAIQWRLCSYVMQKEHIQHWNTYIQQHYTLTSQTSQTPLTSSQEEMYQKIDNMDIDGRNLELIFPILITARLLNYDTFLEILEICKDLIKSKKDDEYAESRDVCLIDFIANNYEEGKLSFISIKDLTHTFKIYMSEADDFEDKWLNEKWMGRALKRLDLIGDSRKMSRGREVILSVLKAKEKLKMFKSQDNIAGGQSTPSS